jgi:hypothetical protein
VWGPQGVIYPVDKGISPDGKPSVIVDYSNTEAIWDLALRDEARRVRPPALALYTLSISFFDRGRLMTFKDGSFTWRLRWDKLID